jgi:hypothetical protein
LHKHGHAELPFSPLSLSVIPCYYMLNRYHQANFTMTKKSSIALDSVVVATTEQISAYFDDAVVILGIKSGSYYSLDKVGLFIWNLLQEPRKVSEIRDAIFEQYDVDPAQCEQDLYAVLDDLATKQLIDIEDTN